MSPSAPFSQASPFLWTTCVSFAEKVKAAGVAALDPDARLRGLRVGSHMYEVTAAGLS
ncbi:hypothetical protein EV644_103600 [Kribbella orskensis]|uniref:Uncharacterized protein n=1 Tax=Kribbella orskensis TaxID=2512216 RepID=A0ABY2BRB3_9ACTN|nr:MULTISPECIES: hypothetical protein [Kribbella]TCN37196.1 hypothetical protein EV642_11262 [Kribbella sp. VKM Ac-2500]TCO27896.1 hypothetical protein EV644_103600 [Kribbella orskensis]